MRIDWTTVLFVMLIIVLVLLFIGELHKGVYGEEPCDSEVYNFRKDGLVEICCYNDRKIGDQVVSVEDCVIVDPEAYEDAGLEKESK